SPSAATACPGSGRRRAAPTTSTSSSIRAWSPRTRCARGSHPPTTSTTWPTVADVASVHLPRLPEQLEPMDAPPLEDDALWDGATVTGVVEVPDGKAELVEITGCHLQGVQLTGCELERLSLVDVIFDDCELSGALLLEARLRRVQFNRCRMSGFVMTRAVAEHVAFTDCKLDAANFRMSSWEPALWLRCELPSADFGGSAIKGGRLLGCNLSRVDMTGAKFERVYLHGSDLTELKGADSLRGVTIGIDQVVPLAGPVFSALGISVAGDPDDEADAARDG